MSVKYILKLEVKAMSADIMEKASELAEAIAASDELAVMRKTEAAMNNDPEAIKIIEAFQEKQKKVYESQMSGGQLSAQERQEIEEIEGKMSGHSAIRAYIDASEKFEHLMRSVNLVISRALSGDDEGGCGCGSSCGTDCGPECGPSCGCS